MPFPGHWWDHPKIGPEKAERGLRAAARGLRDFIDQRIVEDAVREREERIERKLDRLLDIVEGRAFVRVYPANCR